MKLIPLTSKGQTVGHAMVDDEDFDYLTQWTWREEKGLSDGRKHRNTSYAIRVKRTGETGTKAMHRLIMQRYSPVSQNDLTDHWDGNGLNNQKTNLRVCSHSENCMNRLKPKGSYSSAYKGVCYEKEFKNWRCRLKKGKKVVFWQRFKQERDAAIAYDIKAKELFGPFAKCNFDSISEVDLQRVTHLLKS